jgi:exodeoxyribonuclease VII large subunit
MREHPQPTERDEQAVYTVSDLTAQIKGTLQESFPRLWVEGEISNLATPRSGHTYFTLKDDRCQIRAVMFKYVGRRLTIRLEHGMNVLVRAALSVYEPRGEYQLIVDYVEPRGAGALQLAFEQLKARLAAEGLFEAEHKHPLPLFPRKIGVVTSGTGAAFRDILNVIGRRFANVHILLAPVRVQGAEAPGEIVRAIEMLNRLPDVDVLIVGRGGGSLEDLWAFNDEAVARSIFASRIPVIAAVGHEVDYTIADFVADLRAPTPSAAAELVVQNKENLRHTVSTLAARLTRAWDNLFLRLRERTRQAGQRLQDPRKRINELQQRLDDAQGRLVSTFRRYLERQRYQFATLAEKLQELSPLAILARGYAICRRADTLDTVKRASDVDVGDDVLVRVSEGEFRCEVRERQP